MRFVGSRSGRPLLAAFAGIGLASPASGQGWLPEIDAIVQSGDQAAGFMPGTTHGFINWPVQINDAGELAFHGWIDGPDVSGEDIDYHVIWEVDDQGALTAVARGGDPVPSMPGETYGPFIYYSRPMTFVSSAGRAAFFGAVLPSTGFDLFGPFDATPPAPLSLNLVGQPAPGAEPAVLASASWLRGPLAADRPVFLGDLEIGTAGVDAGNDECLFGPGPGGTTLVAREGAAAPGTAPGSLFDSFDELGVGSPIVPLPGAGGSLGFWAFLREGTGDVDATNREGLWLSDDLGDTTLLARTGFQAPGTPAGTLFDGFGPLEPNDVGQLAFVARLRPGTGDATAGNDQGVWATDAFGVVGLPARAGDSAPGAAPGSLFESFDDGSLRFDDLGRVAFRATLAIGTGDVVSGNEVGIWLHDPAGGLSLVVRQGDPVPDQPGSAFSELPPFSRPLLSENGDVAFYADRDGSGSFFQRRGAGPIVTVLTPGMPFEVSPGVIETVASVRGFFGGFGPGIFDLNASGESAHVVITSETGSTVVVTSLPEPGPAPMLGAAVGLLGWLDRRRRRRG